MELAAEVCRIKRELEEQGWVLTNRHAELASRLLSLVGRDHENFLATLDKCQTAGVAVAECRALLQQHSQEHGC